MKKKIFSTKINSVAVNLGLLLLRVSIGGIMLTHGYPKLLRLLDGNLKFGDPIGIGAEGSFILVVFAEFFASIALILGFGSRISAFLLSFTMFVAAFIRHADDPFSKQELSLTFFVVFFFMLLSGPGKYSVDHKIS